MKALILKIGIGMALGLLTLLTPALGQEQDSTRENTVGDTVIMEFGNNSKILFYIQDKKDLEALKKYDLNALLEDFSMKIEQTERDGRVIRIEGDESAQYLRDTTIVLPVGGTDDVVPEESTEEANNQEEIVRDTVSTESTGEKKVKKRKSYHNFGIDLGSNNYLSDGEFPDASNALYTVRPWGSWYLSLNSTSVVANSKHFHIELSGGISWYNFKFQNDKTRIQKTDSAVNFFEDTREVSFRKSKLTVPYLNASFVPVFKFGRDYDCESCDDDWGGFRFGIGAYAGYRIGGYSKLVFREDGKNGKKIGATIS